MTVNELIKALQALPEDVRELPAVADDYHDGYVEIDDAWVSTFGRKRHPITCQWISEPCVIIG